MNMQNPTDPLTFPPPPPGGTSDARRAHTQSSGSRPSLVRPGALRARVIDWGSSCAALLIMICVLLWPAPVDGAVLPGATDLSDLVISHWPSALVLKETVAQAHRLPLWNPFYGGGRPLAADPLAALFYPPTQLVNLLAVRDYFFVLLAGHLLLAGIGVLVLARVALRLSPPAALVAALGFMATPRLIGHLGAGHVTIVQTVAWFPWIALGCWATVRDPARWAVPLGGGLALMALAGHPQMAYYGGLLAAGLSLALLCVRGRNGGGRALVASVAGLAAAGLLAGLLAAVHLVPLLEFTAHSTREQTVRSGDALDLLPFLGALAGLRIPSPVPHEAIFDPGLGILALAGVGVATRRRVAVPILLGVALVAGLALGVASPVYRLVAAVLPSFDLFRGLARIWFVGLLGLALLAGLGADAIIAAIHRSGERTLVAVGVVGGVLLAISLVVADQGLAHVDAVQSRVEPSALERRAAEVAGMDRIYGVQRNVRQLPAVELHADLADGWDPLLIQPYVSFMQRAGGYNFPGYELAVPPFEVYDSGYPTSRAAQPDARLLGLFDIGTVLSRVPLTDTRLVQIDQVDGTLIYRNQANAGAAYLVAPGPGGALPAFAGVQPLPATVRIVERQAEQWSGTIDSPGGGILVFGTPAFPGWEARLDGRPVPLITIDGVLPAVRVTPGPHQWGYSYAPASLRLGAGLSLVGLAAGLAWLIGFALVDRRRTLAALPHPSAATHRGWRPAPPQWRGVRRSGR